MNTKAMTSSSFEENNYTMELSKDPDFVLPKIEDMFFKPIGKMAFKIWLTREWLFYTLIGRGSYLIEETEMWEEQDIYEEAFVEKNKMHRFTLLWINKCDLWEVQIDLVDSGSLGFRFSPDDRDKASDFYHAVKRWRMQDGEVINR